MLVLENTPLQYITANIGEAFVNQFPFVLKIIYWWVHNILLLSSRPDTIMSTDVTIVNYMDLALKKLSQSKRDEEEKGKRNRV